MNSPKVQRALISVTDKTLLAEFAQGLRAAGVEIFASGGTLRHLEEAGIPVTKVAAHTGFPEMMDGRIKTLHPRIHGGILCRRDNPEDLAAAKEHGIVPFELVVVNLYAFEQTAARQDATWEEVIEQIDIGGPTLIRAAAKNHAFVTIACRPAQYDRILRQIQTNGSTTEELRRDLAGSAFAHTAAYDKAVAEYFSRRLGKQSSQTVTDLFPARWNLALTRRESLRYGENPHQLAALYALPDPPPDSLVGAEQLHGKDLSYNNLLDLDSALAIVRALPQPGVAVLKHNNPCGAATAETLIEAMRRAWDGDPLSAFGSILGFNVPVDATVAEFLAEPGRFVEAIIAPDFEPAALEILTTKPKWKSNVRLMKVGPLNPGGGQIEWRQIDGGMLCQSADDLPDERGNWRVVTEAQPTDSQRADLDFAWNTCRYVKSNAIALAKYESLVGVGAGQMSRVDAVDIAIRKAGDRSKGAVLASDAFFPFDDSIHRAAEAGVVAIIQPGGSRGDEAVIAACNQHNLPMIFTACRHFRH